MFDVVVGIAGESDMVMSKPNFAQLYAREMAVIPIVNRIESRGIRWDWQRALAEDKVITTKMDQLLASDAMAGVNPGSWQQVAAFLKAAGMPTKLVTKKGKPTTAAKVVEAAVRHLETNEAYVSVPRERVARIKAFYDALSEYRGLKKISSTYLRPFSATAQRTGGFIFPSINPADTITGRMSGTLQQTPKAENIRTKEQNVVRECVICREGYATYYFDYAQMELYVFGALAGEQRILEAYDDGEDLHQVMADAIGQSRTLTKNITFGCLSVDTPILTNNGWKLLAHVQKCDNVWDGNQWVSHDGVILKGKKTCVRRNGIWMTPDHEILLHGTTSDGWISAAELSIDSQQLELNLESSQLQKLNVGDVGGLSPSSVCARAVKSAIRLGIISLRRKQLDALIAGLKRFAKHGLNMVSFRKFIENESRILYTMRLEDVIDNHKSAMEIEGFEYVGSGSKTDVSLQSICLHYQDGTIANYYLTELITMGRMSLEILDSPQRQKVCLTADLVNCGPLSRYQAGNSIVSNCLYGEGINALADVLGCSVGQAKEHHELYMMEFPSIRSYQNELKERLQADGEMWDWFGKRYCLRPGEAYMAVNAMVQGMCAQIFKTALCQTADCLQQDEHIILPVHDELQIERAMDLSHECQFVSRVKNAFENIGELTDRGLRLKVDVKVTKTNWAEKQPVEF